MVRLDLVRNYFVVLRGGGEEERGELETQSPSKQKPHTHRIRVIDKRVVLVIPNPFIELVHGAAFVTLGIGTARTLKVDG